MPPTRHPIPETRSPDPPLPPHRHHLDLAARLAIRAAGSVEPNPLVGAVLVRNDRIIGMGHHLKFGGPHAEAEALADCRRRTESPEGATMYVTLEPCNHHGKQPPCSAALIAARVARVIIARPDPNPVASGGADALRAAGIAVDFTTASPHATALAAPFARRVTTGMPWVIAKWAQTIDGRIATRTSESKWISCETSRRRVHHLRARVDAILTAIGTVRADDPLLTARSVHLRRTARRIVIDPRAETPLDSALVRSAADVPLTIVYDAAVTNSCAAELAALAARSVELFPTPAHHAGHLDLTHTLRELAARHTLTNILVEAGPGLLGSLLAADLIDEAHVYIAPMLLADAEAKPAATGLVAPTLADAKRFTLTTVRRSGADAMLIYRRA